MEVVSILSLLLVFVKFVSVLKKGLMPKVLANKCFEFSTSLDDLTVGQCRDRRTLRSKTYRNYGEKHKSQEKKEIMHW